MPFCRNCGVNVEQVERFCANCGSSQGVIGFQKQEEQKAYPKRKLLVPLLLLLMCLLLIGIGFLAVTLYADDSSAVSLSIESLSNILPWNQDVRQEDKGRVSEINLRGNSPGNTISYSFLAQQGNWLYFQGNDGIYKSRYNGEDLSKIKHDPDSWASDFNVVGEWVYYVNYDKTDETWLPNNVGIYRTKLDGSESYKVTDDKAEYLNVIGDWIYYVDTDHDIGNASTGFGKYQYKGIYRIKVDGSERTKIIDDWADSIIVLDDWIYYTNTDRDSRLDWGIYRVRIDGTEHIRITNEHAKYINVKDDWIYYLKDDFINYLYDPFDERDYGGIYKVRTNGSGLTRLTDNLTYSLNIVEDWIYFIQVGHSYDEDEYGLYKIDLDGNNYTRLESGYFHNINIHGDWIYLYLFSSEDGMAMIKRISFDGSEVAIYYQYF